MEKQYSTEETIKALNKYRDVNYSTLVENQRELKSKPFYNFGSAYRSKEKFAGVNKQTNAVLSVMAFVFIAFVLIFF